MAVTLMATKVVSAGLTNVAYTALDQVGNIFTFPNYAAVSGGFGLLNSIQVTDDSAALVATTAFVFNALPTLAADNAAFSISDADAQKLIAVVALGPVVSLPLQRFASWIGGPVPYQLSATSLYVALRTDAALAAMASATLLNVTVGATLVS